MVSLVLSLVHQSIVFPLLNHVNWPTVVLVLLVLTFLVRVNGAAGKL